MAIPAFDKEAGRKWMLNANDGIISTAGVVEGFSGAGAQENVILFAAIAVMITGALSLAGATFAEAAQERAAALEIVEEEKRKLRLSPEEQKEELKAHYCQRGLSPDLAERVASELMRKDPLAAQLETEHGILEGPPPTTQPWFAAGHSFLAFIGGALPVMLAVELAPSDWRIAVTFAVSMISLTATGLISAYAGTGHPVRSMVRSLSIGLFIGMLSYVAGSALDVLSNYYPQIEVEAGESQTGDRA
jgi:VIT1/CCC1 family predicted Fe2+/Mn2+ transporter